MRLRISLENTLIIPVMVGVLLSCGGGGSDPAPTASLPATPTALAATAGNQQVALTWNASSDATSYHVKRADVGGAFALIASPTAPAYTNAGLTNGTTYRYVVSAVNDAGESADSVEVSCQPVASATAPATPTGLAASAGDQLVVLTWNASPTATSYHVNRALVGGAFSTVASPTTTTFTDSGLTDGTSYRYTVSAVNANGASTETAEVTCQPAAGILWEPLDTFNTSLWLKSDWTNNGQFNCGWQPDHISFTGGVMTIKLDNTPSHGKSYASGEYRTLDSHTYSYGTFETSMQAAKGSGIVSSFFTYLGAPWDEIDVEILGKNTNQVQFNYFVNGAGGHEKVIDLGFDASAGFHTYAFDWASDHISWYVDGQLKWTVTASASVILPSHPMQIMMNLWPGIGVDGWLGAFTYSAPLYANYDHIKYTPK